MEEQDECLISARLTSDQRWRKQSACLSASVQAKRPGADKSELPLRAGWSTDSARRYRARGAEVGALAHSFVADGWKVTLITERRIQYHSSFYPVYCGCIQEASLGQDQWPYLHSLSHCIVMNAHPNKEEDVTTKRW